MRVKKQVPMNGESIILAVGLDPFGLIFAGDLYVSTVWFIAGRDL